MLKKVIVILLNILVPLGVFVLLGFAAESNRSMRCRSFQVTFADKIENSFVDSMSVIRYVYAKLDTLPGQSFRKISLRKIENLINEMYYVENSEVYRTIDGNIVAHIRQREPIARIINTYNESYYIDRRGSLMKVSPRYTARVVVVSGHIPLRYSPAINLADESKEIKQSQPEKVLRDLYKLINYIENDAFLNAWIDQIYIARNGNFELIPKNGAHVIEFGNISDMEEKFRKLIIFYKNGLAHLGWSNYKRINVNFKNQVVGSK